jgi:hypothetical protein
VPWLSLDPTAVLPGHGRVADLVAALPAEGGHRGGPVGAPPVRPVSRRDLAVVAIGLALAAWLVVRATYGSLPALRWWLPVPLAVLAVAEALGARPCRSGWPPSAPPGAAARVHPGRAAPLVRPVEPMLVARLAVLAQASAYVGAVRRRVGRRPAARGAVGVRLSGGRRGHGHRGRRGRLRGGLTAAALWLESVCRVRPRGRAAHRAAPGVVPRPRPG